MIAYCIISDSKYIVEEKKNQSNNMPQLMHFNVFKLRNTGNGIAQKFKNENDDEMIM